MVAMGTAIVFFIPVGILSRKFGRKKMIIFGILLITTTYFCGFLFKTYSPWINLVFAFTGIAWASINVNSYPMVVEMSRGSDIGKVYRHVLHLLHGCADPHSHRFGGSDAVCALPDAVSIRRVFPAVAVHHAVCQARGRQAGSCRE